MDLPGQAPSRSISPRVLIPALEKAAAGRSDLRLAVYVHVPFCKSKCHFCDWVASVPVRQLRSDRELRRPYIEALRRQIAFYGDHLTRIGYRPEVMYWGGGTPTRLEPDEMSEIQEALDRSFDWSGLKQWTVETTPSDLTSEKLARLQELGMNRMSIGIQSFDEEQLRISGRAHTVDDGHRAIRLVERAGVPTYNLDLILGFPGENPDSFRKTLETALAYDPPHVSVYPYRATPDTVMAMQLDSHSRLAYSVDRLIEAYEIAMEMLAASGYGEYCHGYWVRDPADEDRDTNYKYDLEGDKIGFGSGAESILGHYLLWNDGGGMAAYLRDPLEFSRGIRLFRTRPEVLLDHLGGALMTRDGIHFARFERLCGFSFQDLRRTSFLKKWLAYLEGCGAVLRETPTALSLEPSVIHRVYIRHLANAFSAGTASSGSPLS